MGFFDDDPFEDIVNQFFGNQRARRRTRSQNYEEEKNSQFIEEDNYIYVIIELPGYEEKDISISVKENSLIVYAKSSEKSESQDYLAQKHKEGIKMEQQIPNNAISKKFSKTFRNGVLEVTFMKK